MSVQSTYMVKSMVSVVVTSLMVWSKYSLYGHFGPFGLASKDDVLLTQQHLAAMNYLAVSVYCMVAVSKTCSLTLLLEVTRPCPPGTLLVREALGKS